jgi:hypothetical protein
MARDKPELAADQMDEMSTLTLTSNPKVARARNAKRRLYSSKSCASSSHPNETSRDQTASIVITTKRSVAPGGNFNRTKIG